MWDILAEAAKFTLDLQAVWEVPPDAPQSYVLKSPWAEEGEKPSLTLTVKQSHILELATLEVLVLEGAPTALP